MKQKQIPRELLRFIRDHYEKHHSEILIGEEGKDPEFIIVPFKRGKE